jgi:TolB protein
MLACCVEYWQYSEGGRLSLLQHFRSEQGLFMHTEKRRLVANAAAVAVLSALLGGCGGGNPGTSGTGQDLSIGGLITRVACTSQAPITLSGTGAVVTGIAGGTVSSLTYAAPSPTPDNSAAILSQTQILFQRNAQVYVMGNEGANPHALTTSFPSFSNPTSPAWRPDGLRIAFSRVDQTTGFFQIYTMAPNGTNITKISNNVADDTTPSWSPDGTKIVFNRNFLSKGQIYTMAATGGSPHNVYPTSDLLTAPAWSPDGTQIAFSSATNAGIHIKVMRADGKGGVNTITSGTLSDDQPAWSPDGTRIAFTRHGASGGNLDQIFVVNVDGSGAHSISDGQYSDETPNWRPYLKSRRFIGTGGTLGTTASGFLVGQQGKAQTSLVVFNAATPTTAHLDAQSAVVPGQPNLVFTVSGDQLNALTYINGLNNMNTTVLSASTTATGAVVSFDAADGTVTGVFPYIANKSAGHASPPTATRTGDTLAYRAAFLGAWDATGSNRAPHGATEVQIDSRTGKLLTVQ